MNKPIDRKECGAGVLIGETYFIPVPAFVISLKLRSDSASHSCPTWPQYYIFSDDI